MTQAKIVYQDEDYTKVARGDYSINDDFVTVIDSLGNTIHIGKKYVISIKENPKGGFNNAMNGR